MPRFSPIDHIIRETQTLLAKLSDLQPLSQQIPMVAIAHPHLALAAIEVHLKRQHQTVRSELTRFLATLTGASVDSMDPSVCQRQLTFHRLRFLGLLTQYDIFSDALTQRSERSLGILLTGLEVLARDAIQLPNHRFPVPPVLCYVDRGAGASIRRARTRLPGGSENPVAIIQVPRERLISSGIASSLVHEVGHQASAILDLVTLTKRTIMIDRAVPISERNRILWQSWMSEILADLWAVAKVGITAAQGIMSVLTLPPAFVFRTSPADPHPFPWIRVKLVCVMGNALYPHTQWAHLSRLWESLYPLTAVAEDHRTAIRSLESELPTIADFLLRQRPSSVRGKLLGEALYDPSIRPSALSMLWRRLKHDRAGWREITPARAFALIGYARMRNELDAREEARLFNCLLLHWAHGGPEQGTSAQSTLWLPSMQAKRLGS